MRDSQPANTRELEGNEGQQKRGNRVAKWVRSLAKKKKKKSCTHKPHICRQYEVRSIHVML